MSIVAGDVGNLLTTASVPGLSLGGSLEMASIVLGATYHLEKLLPDIHILVPEPSSLVLLCIGAVGFYAYRWRRRRRVCLFADAGR